MSWKTFFKKQKIDHPASMLRRILSLSMDIFVMIGIVVLFFVLSVNLQIEALIYGGLLIVVYLFLPAFLKSGKTIGNMILSCQVVSYSGKTINFWQLLWRYFIIFISLGIGFILAEITGIIEFEVISYLTILIGIGMPFFRKDNQSYFDLITKTYVRTTYQDKIKKNKNNKGKK